MSKTARSGHCNLNWFTFFKLPVACLVALATLCHSSPLRAENYHPEHPVVQEMINKGLRYLKSVPIRSHGESPAEGLEILIAYAVFKVNYEPDDPIVVRGVNTAKRLAQLVSNPNFPPEGKTIYVIALAGMLLPTVDVDANGEATKQIRDYLLRSQKPHGGFGYLIGGPYFDTGDISQTQYAMLAFWTMSQSGIDVPNEAIVKAINFMVNGQIPDGGWPYQYDGKSPNTNGATNSLSAAGLSSLLIAGDMLNLYRNRMAEADEEDGLVPPAFRRILPESERKKQPNIDRARIDNSAKIGEAWHRAHPYQRATWHYYYVYSKERFESFLEITKRKQNKSPPWYNEEVELLRKNQAADGSWGGDGADADHALSPDVCTSFAVLFLIRSTQKAIGELSEGYLLGGNELPKDLASVKAINGKVISKTEATSVDDALKMLEDDKKAAGEDALVADRMVLATDPKQRKEQLNRFSRLLNGKDYNARRIAAKLLGRGDDIDMAPALIYALTDPDPEVPRIAESSLRLLSRQLDLYHLPKDGKLTDADRLKAATQWKKWFLLYRPGFVFVD